MDIDETDGTTPSSVIDPFHPFPMDKVFKPGRIGEKPSPSIKDMGTQASQNLELMSEALQKIAKGMDRLLQRQISITQELAMLGDKLRQREDSQKDLETRLNDIVERFDRLK